MPVEKIQLNNMKDKDIYIFSKMIYNQVLLFFCIRWWLQKCMRGELPYLTVTQIFDFICLNYFSLIGQYTYNPAEMK